MRTIGHWIGGASAPGTGDAGRHQARLHFPAAA
jgi:hypothetical protein